MLKRVPRPKSIDSYRKLGALVAFNVQLEDR